MLQEILRLPKVKQATGLGRSEIYDRMGRNEFPRPVKLGARAVGWLSEEVAAWQRARISARDGEAAADDTAGTAAS